MWSRTGRLWGRRSHSASSEHWGGWPRSVLSLSPLAAKGAPRREWILIGLAAVFLLGGHPFPAGTLAFGCLFVAALLHELDPVGSVGTSGRGQSLTKSSSDKCSHSVLVINGLESIVN